jgi:hypothetical protein
MFSRLCIYLVLLLACPLALAADPDRKLEITTVEVHSAEEAAAAEVWAKGELTAAQNRGEQVQGAFTPRGEKGLFEQWFDNNVWLQRHYVVTLSLIRGSLVFGTVAASTYFSTVVVHDLPAWKALPAAIISGAMSFGLQYNRNWTQNFYSAPRTLVGKYSRFWMVEAVFLAGVTAANAIFDVPLDGDTVAAVATGLGMTSLGAVASQGAPDVGIATWLKMRNRTEPLRARYNWFRRDLATAGLSAFYTAITVADMMGFGGLRLDFSEEVSISAGKVLMGALGAVGAVFSWRMHKLAESCEETLKPRR